VERILGIYADIDPIAFEEKLPEWQMIVRDSYPISRPISEWTIDIKEVNGIPVLQETVPKAEIIYLLWKRHPQKKQVNGMRLRPSRLVFHLCRDDDKVHDFEEVYDEMEAWSGKWMQHFEVKALKGITLEYINRLNAKTTPQFMLPDGRLQIARAFLMFANIPGRYKSLTSPYECKMRLAIDEKKPCFFDVRVTAQEGPYTDVRIDFVVNTTAVGKAINLDEALAEIRWGHDIMLEEFGCFFTDEAKASFNPYGSDRPEG